jgi:hypothetical protein
MLHCVNFDHALNKRGRALHGLHIGGSGIDNRLIGQIDALKFEAVADWCGQNRECDIFACVQGAASEAGG